MPNIRVSRIIVYWQNQKKIKRRKQFFLSAALGRFCDGRQDRYARSQRRRRGSRAEGRTATGKSLPARPRNRQRTPPVAGTLPSPPDPETLPRVYTSTSAQTTHVRKLPCAKFHVVTTRLKNETSDSQGFFLMQYQCSFPPPSRTSWSSCWTRHHKP